MKDRKKHMCIKGRLLNGHQLSAKGLIFKIYNKFLQVNSKSLQIGDSLE